MLDWKGHMRPQKSRKIHVLDLNTSVIQDEYEGVADSVTASSFNAGTSRKGPYIHHEAMVFVSALNARAERGKMTASIGSTAPVSLAPNKIFKNDEPRITFPKREVFAPPYHTQNQKVQTTFTTLTKHPH